MKKIQKFLLNGLIMTATSLAMNLIGVWFSVYISNKIGTEAMGLFQLIMSVYSFSVTIATSGIHLAATRLVAEELGHNRPQGVKAAMGRCLCYSAFFGIGTALLLYFFADWIGLTWLQNEQTILPIRVMALSLPFLAMSSALTGYFTGVRRVVKNASVQIIEQFVKIFLTMILLSFVMPSGLQYACLSLIIAAIVSEMTSFLCSFTLYLRDRKCYESKQASPKGIFSRLIKIALPIAMSSYLRSGLLTLKNLLVPIRLKKGGIPSSEAYAAFGMIHGIALPVVLFPSSFLASFANLMIPELTEQQAADPNISQSERIHFLINRMFQVSLIFSIGVAGIFLCFSHEISSLFCNNQGAEFYLILFAPLIPIMYFDNVVDCMLKGLNEQFSSMKYNVIDAFISVILVFTLLPIFGVKAYLFTIFVSEILNAALSLNRLITITKIHFETVKLVLKPIFCISLSVIGVRALCNLIPAPAGIQMVLAIFISLPCYFLLLYLSDGITKSELKWAKGIFRK